MLTDATLAPSPERRSAVERAWANLTNAGPLLSAPERHSVIRHARSAWTGAPEPASGPAAEAAHWLAVDAGGLREPDVDRFEAAGLDRWRYLEVVGIVGRLANVDFYVRGLGGSELKLPEPSHDTPSGERHADAALTNMWVPTVGASYAPHVLDALPAEGRALRDIHEPMYVPMVSVGDASYGDVLSKPQIELLAARASYLNDCFY